MKTIERVPKPNNAARLQRFAQERADEQARRIPWQRLLEARNQYIDWQEFYLWVRSILEVEDRVPDWLAAILKDRCPGFMESEKALTPQAARERPLPLRLEDWIDDHIFGFAKQEDWFNAIAFYAVREPRYQRAQACWLESVEQWRTARPIRYPSFEEWKLSATQCDDSVHLSPEVSKEMASATLVTPERLAEAVARYIDWEAFAYWVRPAMELLEQLPAEVVRELEQRCPGFLEGYHQTQQSEPSRVHPWRQLMAWIRDHFFQEAKAEGWYDAIISTAQIHPRAIRTQDYSYHCDELWSSEPPNPYPVFEHWRSEADSYVESPDTSQAPSA